jgi:hypothetical protein
MALKKIKNLKRLMLLIIFFFLYSSLPKIVISCDVTKLTGFLDVCDTGSGVGVLCGAAYIPKPVLEDCAAELIKPLFMMPVNLCFPTFNLGVECISLSTEKSFLENLGSLVKFFIFETASIATNFLIGNKYYSTIAYYGAFSLTNLGYSEHSINKELIVDPSKNMDIYIGPNCELAAANAIEHPVSYSYLSELAKEKNHPMIKYYNCSKDPDKPIIDKAVCLDKMSIYWNTPWRTIKCDEEYKNRCAVGCGAFRGCDLMYPNSIGSCSNNQDLYEACLCNENCQPERVDWRDVFTVTYTINGLQLKTNKEDIKYYYSSGDIEVKVRVDVNDKFKDKLNTDGIIIEFYPFSTIGNIGEEKTFKLKFDPSQDPIITLLQSRLTPIVKRVTFFGNINIPLPKLQIIVYRGEKIICKKYTSAGKNFVILSNGSSLYDPDLEIWNKCCRDGIIEIKVNDVKSELLDRVYNNYRFSVYNNYRFNITIKDNRDPICEDLFGKWEISLSKIFKEEKSILKNGWNQFESNLTLIPEIWWYIPKD